MKIEKLVAAIMKKAAAAKRADTSYPYFRSHPTHIGYYADLAYQLMREENLNLPPLKRLSEIADDSQFGWTSPDVREEIRIELEKLTMVNHDE